MNTDTNTLNTKSDGSASVSSARKSRGTSGTVKLTVCAMFTALTAICSWIQIALPFTPVPVNLATFAVMLSGCILGPVYGTVSQIVYVLLGAVGAPVFSGGAAGFGIIAGPTGGYIIGYVILSAVCGFASHTHMTNGSAKPSAVRLAAAMTLGNILLYATGTAWFMYVTANDLASSLMMCVIPYLPGDALKMIAGIAIVKRLPKSLIQ